MNKKIVMGLLIGGLFACSPAAWTQDVFSSINISSVLEENALQEITARYAAVLVFFQPEEATRLGFSAGNDRLNDRTAQTDNLALQALENVSHSLGQIDTKNLSAAKLAEYHLLQDALSRSAWQLRQNRLTADPLYYAQALDSVYDLLLLPRDSARKQRLDVLSRLEALPQVAQQAKENLTAVTPRLAHLAMEKAYYAYLSYEDIVDFVTNGGDFSNDVRDNAQVQSILQKGKDSVRDLFELFKQLSQTDEQPVSTLSPDGYAHKLKEYYQITDKPLVLERQLDAQWDRAQHQLADALRPFELSADEEEVTVVEDLNERPQEKLANAKQTNRKQPQVYVPPTANQFYAVAGQLQSPFTVSELLNQFTQQANAQAATLLKNQALPAPAVLRVEALPAYFAYQMEYLTWPAIADFWLRLPQGNNLAQAEMLNRNFNEPAVKVLISQELVPGSYYQAQQQKSNLRRVLGNPTLSNGWPLYALNLAEQNQVFVTDEELLFAAWQRFVQTLQAVVDYRLYTQAYSYSQALAFLTEQNGFSEEQATLLLDEILRRPGQALSALVGAALWQTAADKYVAKTKNANSVTPLLLQVGNVNPRDLNGELKRVYKKK